MYVLGLNPASSKLCDLGQVADTLWTSFSHGGVSLHTSACPGPGVASELQALRECHCHCFFSWSFLHIPFLFGQLVS